MILSILEYDKLYIRPKRDLSNNVISEQDAIILQRLIRDNQPIFKWENRCLIAQHWVGVIDLPGFSIEILPKIAQKVDTDLCRDILTRMLLVTHSSFVMLKLPSSIKCNRNGLKEVLISLFLDALETYIKSGIINSYQKVQSNTEVIKGRILFSKQFKENALAPTRFYCRYSKYISNNSINQFFMSCLLQMSYVSRDNNNLQRIKIAKQCFVDVDIMDVRKALGRKLSFNSINHSAAEAYDLGYMFLSSNFLALSAGNISINSMLFDMNKLFETFMFRAIRQVYGGKAHYQSRCNYMVEQINNGKNFVKLRPDIIINNNSGNYIIDMKWKMPKSFPKESDVYQMNAYSTAIANIKKVFLLYPKTSNSDILTGDYLLKSCVSENRNFGIREIDLGLCTNWKVFIKEVKTLFGTL